MKEYGDKIPADKKAAIETALGKLKDAHKAADIAGIDAAMTELNNAWQAASNDIYASQQAQQQQAQNAQSSNNAQQGAQGNGNNNQPEDVEFEEVK